MFSDFILGLISLCVFFYAIVQITKFYNVTFVLHGPYSAFYIFMSICILLFKPTNNKINEIKGLINKINLTSKKGEVMKSTFNSAKGKVEMITMTPPPSNSIFKFLTE